MVHPDASQGPPALSADRAPHWRPTLILFVFAGGMAGTLCRYMLDGLIPAPQGLPLPTLAINLSGSFFLGVLLEALIRAGDDQGKRRMGRLLAGTGFLGGFTTYSAFAVEAVLLGTEGSPGLAASYVGVSVIGGMLLGFAGIRLAGAVSRIRSVRRQARFGRITQ